MAALGLQRRAKRALIRQLEYQQRKAPTVEGREQEIMAAMAAHSSQVRQAIERVKPIPEAARVLEVGSGAHGLIFFFDAAERIGVDPLAEHYQNLFPAWQQHAPTVAAFGESLPFDAGHFDIVLCYNVVDHAEDPRKIVEEAARVLRPGGILYFSVNVHHRVWQWAAGLHATWRAAGLPFEITPFADHTFHLTLADARRLFAGLPFTIATDRDDIGEAKRQGAHRVRHIGGWFQRMFFKNARYELIAERR